MANYETFFFLRLRKLTKKGKLIHLVTNIKLKKKWDVCNFIHPDDEHQMLDKNEDWKFNLNQRKKIEFNDSCSGCQLT